MLYNLLLVATIVLVTQAQSAKKSSQLAAFARENEALKEANTRLIKTISSLRQESCQASFVDQDIAGADVAQQTVDGGSDPVLDAACCNLCSSNRDCTFWVRESGSSGSKMCWLKKEPGSFGRSLGRRGALKKEIHGAVEKQAAEERLVAQAAAKSEQERVDAERQAKEEKGVAEAAAEAKAAAKELKNVQSPTLLRRRSEEHNHKTRQTADFFRELSAMRADVEDMIRPAGAHHH
jgi:hypothetical protein